jgi:hypothetical protein
MQHLCGFIPFVGPAMDYHYNKTSATAAAVSGGVDLAMVGASILGKAAKAIGGPSKAGKGAAKAIEGASKAGKGISSGILEVVNDVEKKTHANRFFPDKTGLNPLVKPIDNRMPRNAMWAGKVMPAEEVGKKLNKYHKKNVHNPYQQGVAFTGEGFPDFTKYSIRRVKIKMTGNGKIDQKLADEAAGFVGTNKRPDGYTWHHHYDRETMELIPTDLNGAIGHDGGASIVRSINE